MSRLPPANPREVVAVLKQTGFVEHHQKGGHLYLWHPLMQKMVCVPQHPGDLKMGTLRAILKQAGLTVERFNELR